MENNGRGIMNLIIESHHIQGAREMLMKLMDTYNFVPKEKGSKDDVIYTQAELDMILSSKDNTRHFMYGDKSIRYRNHERDKKGRLKKVEAYFE